MFAFSSFLSAEMAQIADDGSRNIQASPPEKVNVLAKISDARALIQYKDVT